MSTRGLNMGLVLLVMLAFVGALTVGPAGLGLRDVLSVLPGNSSEASSGGSRGFLLLADRR